MFAGQSRRLPGKSAAKPPEQAPCEFTGGDRANHKSCYRDRNQRQETIAHGIEFGPI